MEKIAEVLKRLDAAGLRISLEKSEWVKGEVKYLGYVIGAGVLKMDPEKIEAIKKIPLPTKVGGHYRPNLRKQIRRFGSDGVLSKVCEGLRGSDSPID